MTAVRDPAKELQVILARNGRWLDQDDAVRLSHEVGAGMPFEKLVEQAVDCSRPLTAAEKAKFAAALSSQGGVARAT